ncbi:reticuline oxidase-like protein [Quillaja saponaria]|uniref:Reticuline oxidase-like protein n=1 Tax=Quillaja saponaria TaxID=32244 RepID=A0AAD7M3B9_QUISA|nr:reticuline oxidase-like protein [Quillaja saponaria]
MTILSYTKMLLLLPILVLCFAWPASISAEENFVQCLISNSLPSEPITPAIFVRDNSTFTSVLNSLVRNLRFNTSTTRKPFLIITALHVSHVQAAVVCGKKFSLQLKIRSGGHNYEGISYVAEVPFFILDLFNLRSIDVDIKTESAWVQVGATLGELYYEIANKSKTHGFPAGVCPTVGVGGHLSGGGYGNMMRKYGLTVDNLIDAQVVDVNGRFLDRKSMGEDLFWAISGGGGSSFAVVISYKIHLVRVPEIVTVFRVQRNLEQNATDIVFEWEQVAPSLDKDLFIRLTMDVINSTTQNGTMTVRATFLALFLGDSKRLLSITNTSFPSLGLKESDCIEQSWVQSVLFWTNFPLGTPAEALLDRRPQTLTFLKRGSDYVKTPIPKVDLERIFKRMIELEAPMLTFNPYGGRMAEIPASATPFPHRAGNLWKIQYATNWNEPGNDVSEKFVNLTRNLRRYMTPFVSKNPREAFYNYQDLDLGINHNGKASFFEGKVYGIKYFKGNFYRLVKVKTQVDPNNFFRNEQSVPTLPH